MPFRGTRQVGQKGIAGRKTKAKELEQAIAAIKEKVTNEALIELARSKVFKQIQKFGDSSDVAKDFALPITLKGIIEKKDITSAGKPIPILGNYVSDNTSNSEDNKTEQEN